MPTYFLTTFRLQKWAIKEIDKMRRGFLWKGTADAKGGQCLVNWSKTKKAKEIWRIGDTRSRSVQQSFKTEVVVVSMD